MLQKLLNAILKPYYAILFPVLLSLFAWLVPDSWINVRGFGKKESFGTNAFGILLSWYFFAIISSFFFFYLGKKNPQFKKFNKIVSIDNIKPYLLFTLIAWTGFIASFYKIISSVGLSSLYLILFVDHQGNKTEQILYENYSIGILSLRYVLILTFGISLYRLQIFKEYKLVNFLNIIFFIIYTAVLGRRLQVIFGLFVYLSLANSNGNLLKLIKAKYIYLSFFLITSLVIVATTVRNYNTFKEKGSTNVFSATLDNIIEYLGPPMQVTFSIANNIDKAIQGRSYWEYTNVGRSLTTNSAFSELIIEWGWWSYFYSIIVCGFWSYIAGWAYKNKYNYLFIIYPIIIYAFLEYWRINLFSTGIFSTLMYIGILVPIVLVVLNKK